MKALRIAFLLMSTVAMILLIIANQQDKDSLYILSFSSAYTLIPLIGGIIGLVKFHAYKHDYGFKYVIAGTIFSAGQILWSIGSVIWTYYYLQNYNEPPYPSLADIFYISHSLCWMLGILVILRGLKADLLSDIHKISPYIILLLVNSYLILFQDKSVSHILNDADTREFKRHILNLTYTLTDIINICLLIICIFGKSFIKIPTAMKLSFAFMAVGLCINYVANLVFAVQLGLASANPVSELIGSFVDYLYAVQFVLLTMAILNIPRRHLVDHHRVS